MQNNLAQTKPLSELAERFVNGGTPDTRVTEHWNGDIPWITGADINGLHVSEGRKKITKAAIKNSSTHLVPKNTVLLVTRTSVGKVSVSSNPLCFSQDITGIICRPLIRPMYLARYLVSIQDSLTTKVRGSTIKGLARRDFSQIQVPVPTREHQERIEAILERADSLQARREQANQLTNKIIQSIFLKMFGNPAINPNHWPKRKLDELAELRGGIQLSKERKPQNHPRPYLTIRNVYSGRLDLSDVRYMEVGDEELKRWILKSGDLLALEGGDRDDVGRTAIFRGELEKCVHQNHVFRIRVNRARLIPEFLMHYLNSAYVKSQFFMMAKATTGINSINMTQLKSVGVLCPPVDLQGKFTNILNHVQELEDTQRHSSQEINQLCLSLAHKAFRSDLNGHS